MNFNNIKSSVTFSKQVQIFMLAIVAIFSLSGAKGGCGGGGTRDPQIVIASSCGNGTLDEGEVCDDGNDDDSDGCRNNCEAMVFVTAGDFYYGPPANGDNWTSTETLPDFYIDIHEVTAGQYKACVDADECDYNGSTSSSYRTYENNKDNHPINYVSWHEAVAYCAWKGKRLPTEVEWEKAARGTDGRTYPWGNQTATCSYAVMSGCDGDTQPVGSKESGKSPYGAHDMAGNVWEWTNSLYFSNQSYRVLRGGMFDDNEYPLRSSYRNYLYPTNRHSGDGFRCSQCTTGFAGPDCIYSDAVTCSGNGVVADDGTCACNAGLGGADCSTSVPSGMVSVPAGDFYYGPAANGDNWTRLETLPDFFIDIYEVTAGEYKACVEAGECSYNGALSDSDWGGLFRTYNNGKDNHPINDVNWQEAKDYCSWKGKRLPTETEWEKAARGTDGRTYPWGDQTPTCDYAVMSGCSGETQPAGSRESGKSPYGAYDMAGNVGEWTDSLWSSGSSYRVLRGGSFYHAESGLRSSYRYDFSPTYRSRSLGFRCSQ